MQDLTGTNALFMRQVLQPSILVHAVSRTFGLVLSLVPAQVAQRRGCE
jgi:hypothetical protein